MNPYVVFGIALIAVVAFGAWQVLLDRRDQRSYNEGTLGRRLPPKIDP